MNVVVVGMGEVGKNIAQYLSWENHDVTIIDNSSTALAEAEEVMDVLALMGPGGSLATLRKAEVGNADLVIAVTDDEEVNLLCAHTAKQLGAKKVVARVSSQDYIEGETGFYHNILGIEMVISPQVLAAIEFQKQIRSIGAVMVENYAQNRIELIQLPLDEQLKVVGRRLQDLHMPPGTLIAAIKRDAKLIIPRGDDELLLNDEVFVIGNVESMSRAEEYFGKKKRGAAKKVVIVGGGNIGFSIARSLQKDNIDIILIEKDKDICRKLSESLDNVLIVNGDGTNINLLKEVGVENCDALVSVVSHGEEINLLSGLIAKKLGAQKAIVLVHRPAYQDLYEQVGIDATVSPRLVAANQILKYVRRGEIIGVSILEGGMAEIIELIAPERSGAVGKKLKDIKFPKGAIVGALAGEDGVIIPTGEDQIEPGMTVILIATPEVRSKVEKLFAV
ncbi:MAG TPA: Trk system potassium transporter TrkA [candidate division Zixibacteria bacterium]|nr:Trk system potassium transporter TrkA [candidate division Zixibacteria bacterium]